MAEGGGLVPYNTVYLSHTLRLGDGYYNAQPVATPNTSWSGENFCSDPPTVELSIFDEKFQTLKTLEYAPPQAETPPSNPLDVPRLHLVDL